MHAAELFGQSNILSPFSKLDRANCLKSADAKQVGRRLPSLPAGEEQALSRATCEMLSACISPTLAHAEAARPSLELVLQRRARRFIEVSGVSALKTI